MEALLNEGVDEVNQVVLERYGLRVYSHLQKWLDGLFDRFHIFVAEMWVLGNESDDVHAAAYTLVSLFVHARFEELLLWWLSLTLLLAQIQSLPTDT